MKKLRSLFEVQSMPHTGYDGKSLGVKGADSMISRMSGIVPYKHEFTEEDHARKDLKIQELTETDSIEESLAIIEGILNRRKAWVKGEPDDSDLDVSDIDSDVAVPEEKPIPTARSKKSSTSARSKAKPEEQVDPPKKGSSKAEPEKTAANKKKDDDKKPESKASSPSRNKTEEKPKEKTEGKPAEKPTSRTSKKPLPSTEESGESDKLKPPPKIGSIGPIGPIGKIGKINSEDPAKKPPTSKKKPDFDSDDPNDIVMGAESEDLDAIESEEDAKPKRRARVLTPEEERARQERIDKEQARKDVEAHNRELDRLEREQIEAERRAQAEEARRARIEAQRVEAEAKNQKDKLDMELAAARAALQKIKAEEHERKRREQLAQAQKKLGKLTNPNDDAAEADPDVVYKPKRQRHSSDPVPDNDSSDPSKGGNSDADIDVDPEKVEWSSVPGTKHGGIPVASGKHAKNAFDELIASLPPEHRRRLMNLSEDTSSSLNMNSLLGLRGLGNPNIKKIGEEILGLLPPGFDLIPGVIAILKNAYELNSGSKALSELSRNIKKSFFTQKQHANKESAKNIIRQIDDLTNDIIEDLIDVIQRIAEMVPGAELVMTGVAVGDFDTLLKKEIHGWIKSQTDADINAIPFKKASYDFFGHIEVSSKSSRIRILDWMIALMGLAGKMGSFMKFANPMMAAAPSIPIFDSLKSLVEGAQARMIILEFLNTGYDPRSRVKTSRDGRKELAPQKNLYGKFRDLFINSPSDQPSYFAESLNNRSLIYLLEEDDIEEGSGAGAVGGFSLPLGREAHKK